jgi:hypothetical protein
MIYRFVAVGHVILVMKWRHFNHPLLFPSDNIEPLFTRGLATGVCRQIRSESRLFELRRNIFHFDTIYSLHRFLSLLPAPCSPERSDFPNLGHIRGLLLLDRRGSPVFPRI